MQARVPYLLRKMLPQLVWEVRTSRKEIFLTFDDGPHPEVTPLALEILEKYGARATFFCVGENVSKYPQVYNRLIRKGHKTGNHTYNHLNGWKVPRDEYFENIEKCSAVVDSSLFRPPYGRISIRHIPYLKMKYRIIMWTVLSMDFSRKTSPGDCLQNVMNHTKPGSIIVFHDSEKAADNMLYALPRFLEHFQKQGYVFSVL